jgi:hypothetical protein
MTSVAPSASRRLAASAAMQLSYLGRLPSLQLAGAVSRGERLSLRRVAKTVGVSHQAPYVHFGDKRRFLAAVAGMGLQEAADEAAIARSMQASACLVAC